MLSWQQHCKGTSARSHPTKAPAQAFRLPDEGKHDLASWQMVTRRLWFTFNFSPSSIIWSGWKERHVCSRGKDGDAAAFSTRVPLAVEMSVNHIFPQQRGSSL